MRLEFAGSSTVCPVDWVVVGTDAAGSVLAEPGGADGGFRASLVMTAEALGDVDFATWQNDAEALEAAALQDFRLIDREKISIAGHPGGRRVAHHVDGSGRAVVLCQWFTLVNATGWTLSGTVDAPRYDLVADVFERAASEWVFPASVGGGSE